MSVANWRATGTADTTANKSLNDGLPESLRQVLPFYGYNWDALTRLVSQRKLPQTLLFEGREGCGLDEHAQFLSALLLCESHQACGICEPCSALIHSQHADLLWLHDLLPDGKHKPHYVLEDMAAIHEHLALAPLKPSLARVVVISHVDKLLHQAANSLLKILEEPPAHAVFILTTHRKRTLLPTILSRTVQWRVTPPAVEQLLMNYADQIAEKQLTQEQVAQLLRRAGYTPLGFLRELQQSGQDGQFVEDVLRCLRVTSVTKRLAMYQELELEAQAHPLSMLELVQQLEVALNKWYQQTSDFSSNISGDVSRSDEIRHRRQVLRQLKRFGIDRKITLNVKMALQSFFLGREP